MVLSQTSRKRLHGVHPDLVKVVERAVELASIAGLDFMVVEGVRSLSRQKQLVAAGASTTFRSRHLTGHAVDLGAIVPFEDEDGDGEDDDGIHGLRWDWPLYNRLAELMKQAARDVDVPLEAGVDWKVFKDGPHYQLPWKTHPESAIAPH